MITKVIVSDTVVYDSLPEFEWEKYQRGYMGILNNAYNQSCNSGGKTLGNMSEITSEFDGGSYDDFIDFYYENHNGKQKRTDAIKKMSENLIKRVRAIGGELSKDDAIDWSRTYIQSMLVNSYRGFIDEARAIELVAEDIDESWNVADPEMESDGVDGYIGGQSVQVKPTSYTDLDINSFDADWLITYTYDDGMFEVVCQDKA
jgi:transcription elongation factor Elf1